MWLYVCYSLVFVHVFTSNWAHNDKKYGSKEAEALFAGVVKNISRVNNDLQELISNYKKLQKIYKPQENLYSATSDDETDEVHNSNKKDRSRDETSTIQPVGAGTEMIWSENEGKSEETSISYGNDEETRNNTTDDEEEKSSDENQPVKYESDKSAKFYEQDNEESEKTSQSKSKPTEPKILNQKVVKPKQAAIVFIDTHVKESSEEENKWTQATETPAQTLRVPKTRFSKISHIRRPESNVKLDHKKKSKYKSDIRRLGISKVSKSEPCNNTTKNTETRDGETNKNEPQNTEPRTALPSSKPLKNNTDIKRNVEKKIYFESFPSNDIWGDIISNKTIMLKDHNQTVIQKIENKDSKRSLMRSDNHKHETDLIIATNKNRKQPIDKSVHDSTDKSDSAEQAEKDEFQAKILRQAYGDVCFKLVIRKCHKACKAASKSVCDKYKCTSIFKTAVQNFSKTACLEQFDEKRKQNTDKPQNSTRHRYRNGKSDSSDSSGIVDTANIRAFDNSEPNIERKKVETVGEKGFVDIARQGYMQACLPHVSQELRTNETKASRDEAPFAVDAIGRSLNILRDKYEKECKKISYKKCKAACEKSYKRACETHQCVKDKKRAYQKSCKKECKKAYKLKKKSSSSSSGSSDSDSD